MKKVSIVLVVCKFIALLPARLEALPSVYPTGTTIYDPAKAWNGDVIFDKPEKQGAVLIDMNGNELRHWPEIAQVPGPTRILPGGFVMGGDRWRAPHQEAVALVQLDWDGKEVWRFDRLEKVVLKKEDDEEDTCSGARGCIMTGSGKEIPLATTRRRRSRRRQAGAP